MLAMSAIKKLVIGLIMAAASGAFADTKTMTTSSTESHLEALFKAELRYTSGSESDAVVSAEHIATISRQPECRFEDLVEDIASQYFNEEQRRILKEAVAAGVTPLPDEN
jgi:hypothetical protein